MNVVQFPRIDRKRESAYLACKDQKSRLAAERARAIQTLERVLASVTPKAVTEDRIEACGVMREILAELRAMDPGGMDDEHVPSTVNDRLKAFRVALSKSCFRVCGGSISDD